MEVYCIVGGVFVLFLVAAISWYLSDLILKPRIIPPEKLYLKEIREGRLREEEYKGWTKEEFLIKSPYGYELSCQLLDAKTGREVPGEEKNKRLAILCHGYTRGKYSSILYAGIFLRQGIPVLIYDHRNHGSSGKAFTSMGYYEKFDLKAIVDDCLLRYGEGLDILLHGESMGAATLLSYLCLDNPIRCAIADCAYSNLEQLILHLMRTRYQIPKYPFLPLAKLLIRLRGGFRIEDVVPKEGVVSYDGPILFIHGLEDDYVPCSMSMEMYEAKGGNREIYLAPKAGHAQSCQKNREEYEEVVVEFLKRYYFS